MLLTNKMIMQYIPVPSVISFIQIVASTIALLVMKALGVKIDALGEYVHNLYNSM